MKLANVRGMVAKGVTVGLLAGAVVVFAPTKAQAQEAYFGDGDHARHEFYERERIEAVRRHEEFERRQAWLREQEFRHEQHERWENRGFDRDHYGHERFERDGYR